MIDAVGYAAGFLAMITFLPQVIKTLQTKKAADISMAMLLLTLVANVLYVIYGILLRLYPVIVMVGVMTFVVIIQIVLTVKYRGDEEAANNTLDGTTKSRPSK